LHRMVQNSHFVVLAKHQSRHKPSNRGSFEVSRHDRGYHGVKGRVLDGYSRRFGVGLPRKVQYIVGKDSDVGIDVMYTPKYGYNIGSIKPGNCIFTYKFG
jgi:hypothetical protein